MDNLQSPKSEESFSSKDYWENRYKNSGNSGSGSYNKLAEFKAEILNHLFGYCKIDSVIEFGCGDGNQLGLLKCNQYIGLDVSIATIQRCKAMYEADKSKSFFLYDHRAFVDNAGVFCQDCAISLDVLYHLVEEEVYEAYIKHLFASANKLVIIYAADFDLPQIAKHVLYRKFTTYIEAHIPEWKLEYVQKNMYPATGFDDDQGSMADFYIYVKNAGR